MQGNFGRLEGNLGDMIDLGGVPGAIPYTKFGYGVVGTNFSTIYSPGASPGLYEYLPTYQQVAVASTDPDDNVNGTGANRVTISGLCELGCIHTEQVELQGQTPVSTETVFSRVFRVSNDSLTGHDLQGQLYVGPVTATWIGGEPSQILAHINDGYNQTQMALATVPRDYSLFVYNVALTAPRDKAVEIGVFVRGADVTNLANCSVFAIKVNWLLSGSPLSIGLGGNPFVLPELVDYEFRAKVDVGTASVAANITGYLIPNKYIRKSS